MNDNKSVLIKCKENIDKIEEIRQNDRIEKVVKVMLEPLEDRVKKIEEICSVEKYTLSFIGKVGVGKSTAISNLVGLINENKLSKDNELKDIPLFKTAVGRTTACETMVVFTDDNKCRIEIEPLKDSEFERMIDEYCDNLSLFKDSKQEDILSQEARRIIRNMSKYPERETEDKQMDYIRNIIPDVVVSEDKLEQKKLVKAAILQNIQYKNRTKKKLECEERIEELVWLRDTVKAINDGLKEEVPYPKKIIVYINRNNCRNEIPKFIDKIVDTRGIDANDNAREDIITVCKSIDTICILCDSIPEYGNLISDTFLKRYFSNHDKDIKYRSLLLGIEHGRQLKDVNEASGRESGKDIKKTEAVEKWKNVCLDEENLDFYNAYFGIKYDNENIILNVDYDTYNREQKMLFAQIENMLSNMYKYYSEELKTINKQLNAFAQNRIKEEHKVKFLQIYNDIDGCWRDVEKDNKKSLQYKHQEENLGEKLESTNASILRASVNRNGSYYNCNIYTMSGDIAREIFDEVCGEKKYHIEKIINDKFSTSDSLDEALKSALILYVNRKYNDYRNFDAEKYKELMEKILLENDFIWNNLKREWGSGRKNPSYRVRIKNGIIEEVENKISKRMVKNKMIEKFFDELKDFIDINKLQC